jgi:guanylate kinase
MAGARKAKRKAKRATSKRKMRAIARRGLMLVLSSPSGAGKTTLSRLLLKADPSVKLSVSVTTRPRRAGEKHGSDYLFIQKPQFDRMVEKGELLEWAEVFGNFYGTPRAPVEKALAAGRDVLFDIDWQGTQQLREKVEADVATIFVLPPSSADLEKRLRTRAQDSDEVIASRMAKAADEMTHFAEYDYVIINKDIDQAYAEVRAILAAERLKRQRQTGLHDFVSDLRDKL